mgnify:CR=1 FL=1
MQLSDSWQDLISVDAALRESAIVVLSGSSFAQQWGERHPNNARQLVDSGDIHFVYNEDSYQQRLAEMLEIVSDETELQRQLRYFRQREMVRIIWRDLAGLSDLAETVSHLSAMADACIQQTLAVLHQWQCNDLGTPCNV